MENELFEMLFNQPSSQEKKVKKPKARTDRFPKDGGKPVKASVPGYNKIPWTQGTLTLVAQSPDGQLHYAKTMDEKKQFAWSNFNWILVCWPGQYTQDIFLIDNIEAFRIALGFKKREEPTILVDENGEEWVDTKPSVSIPIRPRHTYDVGGDFFDSYHGQG